MKKLAKSRKALFAVGIVIFALIATEVGLRSILGLGNPPLLVADDDIGYMFAAGQDLRRFGRRVKINRYHQRSGDICEQPRPGIHRILCVGDSVTWGGVLCQQHRTYPEVVRRLLVDAGMPAPEVLNASAGSWAIGNRLAYLRRFGTFGSQLVILQIGSGDLLQTKSTSDCIGSHPSFPDRKPILAIGELACRYVLPRFLKRSTVVALRPSSKEQEANFCQNMHDFRACIGLIRQGDAEIIVLHNRRRTEVLEGPSDGAIEGFRARFLAICHEEDIVVVDLAEIWRDEKRAETFFRDTVHLTEEGNVAAAEALLSVVR